VIFSSQVFIFCFAPLAILLFWVLPQRWRLCWLVVTSYVFYAWADWRFCQLMLTTTLVDFSAAQKIAARESKAARRAWLAFTLFINLGLLGFFKYAVFFSESFNALFAVLHQPAQVPIVELVFPVGISFYTFVSLGYTIDVYRGTVRPTRSFVTYAAYVSMFPHLVAGPIIRWREMGEQLAHIPRRLAAEQAALGCLFFAAGLSKKVLIADRLALYVDPLWSDYMHLSGPEAWAATLGYGLQVYFDFAGYSLMAVGLGLLLGLRLPQNFNSPYRAADIADFWHRWHISLSTWLRDYVFLTIGGLRIDRRWFAVFLTMVIAGLWHGANWTFVLWGAYHGALLVIHHALRAGKVKWYGGWPGRIGTLLLVMLGWVLFRSDSLRAAGIMYSRIFDLASFRVAPKIPATYWPLLIVALLWAVMAPNAYEPWHTQGYRPSRRLVIALGLLAALAVMLLSQSSPFLYYQF
jgi:alginate O-acetyltransferase complex protein AlgI